jgi:hypothetical protein
MTTPITSGLFFFLVIFSLAYYIYMSLCVYLIAKKTHRQKAWFAWIPILNILLELRIARKSAWWIIWYFIPLVNLIVYIIVWMRICRRLHKPEWLGLLIIISPFDLIISGYLAFSKIDETPKKPEVKIVNVSL